MVSRALPELDSASLGLAEAPVRPFVLYGALRSGTTLLSLMLGGHPRLHFHGESDFLFDHVRRVDETWIVDLDRLGGDRVFLKSRLPLPGTNDARAAVAELIAGLQARRPGRLLLVLHRNLDLAYALVGPLDTLHLLRDPRDVARSSVKIGFAGRYAFGADHWMTTERTWARCAAEPDARRHEVRYEDLVSSPVDELAEICRFLGIPYDDGLFAYVDGSGYGRPDPRMARQWQKDVAPADIGRLEQRLGPALAQAGYAPSGHAAPREGPLEAWVAPLMNRAMIWWHLVRHYGLVAPVLRGVGRRTGLVRIERLGQAMMTRRFEELNR